MITLLEALQEANSATPGIKGLSFANIQEFASFQDSFNFQDWPRNIIVPPNLSGTITDYRVNEVINIQGWMVTRINQDTNDYRSVKIEPDFIAPMRAAARKFILKLVDSELTNSEAKTINYRIGSEYQWLHSHLFGVFYSLDWPVRAKLC